MDLHEIAMVACLHLRVGFEWILSGCREKEGNRRMNSDRLILAGKNGRPNITMEEYIRLEEEKARRAIVFDNTLTTLQFEATICPPNENMIDFKISLDESDDEDYTVIFDENSFSYKIVSVNDLKTDSKNDNNEIPFLPNPTVNYFNDLDFFKDFEHEFLAIVYKAIVYKAIVYNDGQTSKSDYLTEPIVNPKHIDEFNLNDKTSLSEYDEENDSHFNDLFNINHPDDSKSIKDNDDNNIDIIQSSEDMTPVPVVDQRHPWLKYQIKEYTEGIRHSYEQRLETIWSRWLAKTLKKDSPFEPDSETNEPPLRTYQVFLMLFGVTAALIDVNAAQSKLVLLENFNENYSKCLRLLVKLQLPPTARGSYYCYTKLAAEGVNAASKEVSTAKLVSTAYLMEFDLLKWDQQVVSELVALRNFARRYGSRFCTHGGCIQSSHAQTE
ncbi:hypothetical protein Tco_0675146 [Tanacetum coccineum]